MIIVESQAVGPFFKNGFIVACPRTHQGVMIDPGDEVDSLLAFVSRRRIAITHILLTHAHVDHVTGVPRAVEALGVPVCLHQDDLFLYKDAVSHGLMFGLRVDPLPPVDHFYGPDDVFTIGDIEIRPHHTPGHCPGGVCLAVTSPSSSDARRPGPEVRSGTQWDLFVGDTLFAGSIGRTDLPGGHHATLLHSIRTVLFPFGDEARVYPGHGPATTIGRERRTNPFLAGQSV